MIVTQRICNKCKKIITEKYFSYVFNSKTFDICSTCDYQIAEHYRKVAEFFAGVQSNADEPIDMTEDQHINKTLNLDMNKKETESEVKTEILRSNKEHINDQEASNIKSAEEENFIKGCNVLLDAIQAPYIHMLYKSDIKKGIEPGNKNYSYDDILGYMDITPGTLYKIFSKESVDKNKWLQSLVKHNGAITDQYGQVEFVPIHKKQKIISIKVGVIERYAGNRYDVLHDVYLIHNPDEDKQ